MARLVKIFSVVFFGLLVSNCTRKMEDPANLSFNLSKAMRKGGYSAQGADDGPSFIAINIKDTTNGSLFKCTLDDGGNDESDVPAQFDNPKCVLQPNGDVQVNNDFPSGRNYLIQVLLIEEIEDDDGKEKEYFNYGEGQKVLVAGNNNSVPIHLSEDLVSEGVEGSVSGRYLKDGQAYTGKLKLEYVPKNRPNEPMEIFDLYMFNGFFEIFVFNDVKLQYRMVDLPSKPVLFNGPVFLGSSNLQASGTQVAVVDGPEVYYSDGPNSDSDSQDPWSLVLGFWNNGQPDAGGQVCIDTTAHTSSYVFTDSGLSNELAWPNDFVTVGGDSCSMADPIVTTSVLTIDGELMATGGGGRLFYGPFMKMNSGSGNYNFLNYVSSGSDMTLSWKYLPGTSNLVAGVAIFYKEDNVSDSLKDNHDGGQGFDCQTLPVDWQRVDVGAGVESVTLSDVGSDLLSEGKVFVCPKKLSIANEESPFLPTVLETNPNDNDYGGGGSYGKPAVELQISTGNGGMLPYINRDTCTKVELAALDEDSNYGMLTEYPYTVSLSQNEGSFYTDGGCGTPLTGNKFDMYGALAFIWYKATTNTSNAAWEASADSSNTDLIASSGSVSIAVQTPATPTQLSFDAVGPLKVYTTECVDLLLVLQDANGVPSAYQSSQLDVSMGDTSGNGAFYSDENCTTSNNNFAINTSMAYSLANYLPSVVDDGQTISVTMSNSPDAYTNNSINMEVYDPGPATYAIVEDLLDPVQDTCDYFYIRTFADRIILEKNSPNAYPSSTLNYNLVAVDDNGDPVSVSFFDTESECNSDTPTITTYSQNSATLMKRIYYKIAETVGTKFHISIDEQNYGDSFDNTSKELEVQ